MKKGFSDDDLQREEQIINPMKAYEIIKKQDVEQIKSNEMTAFKNTIVGKLIGKGKDLAGNVAKVVSSPNPLQAAAAALTGGVSSANKAAAAENKSESTRSISKASSSGSGQEQGQENFFTKNKTILGYTFPLWIWLAVLVVLLVVLWWLFKRFISKSPARRRSGGRSSAGSSAMRARMARVRAARRKRK